MRKVSKEIASAFIAGKRKTMGNTHTDGKTLWLHGNAIARRNDKGGIEISSAGWETVTTKERLNTVLYYLNAGYVQQKNWQWFVGGKLWPNTREWIEVYSPSK
jgi:hypothetical protein